MITTNVNKLIGHRYSPFKGPDGKAFFALAAVCFLWGTTWMAARIGVQYIPPLQLAGLRQLSAGTIYIIYFTAKGYRYPKGKEWISIFILSFLNFMMSNGLATWGVKYISSGLGAIIGAIFPLWLVIIGFLKPHHRVSNKIIAGIALGFGGVCLIFYEHLVDFFNPDFRFGIFISLIATVTWALGTIYTKSQAVHFNPYFSLGLQMFISGIVVYSLSEATGSNYPLSGIPWQSWVAIVYLVAFGSVIAFTAYLYALQKMSTTQVSIYAYINPVVAIVLGALLLNEKFNVWIGLGTCIALLGVFLVNNGIRKMIVKT